MGFLAKSVFFFPQDNEKKKNASEYKKSHIFTMLIIQKYTSHSIPIVVQHAHPHI
jgi:hypothetical protein